MCQPHTCVRAQRDDRPHLPFAAPSEFYDMLPSTKDILPPMFNRPPKGSPAAAWHPGGFGVPPSTYNVSCPQDETKVMSAPL